MALEGFHIEPISNSLATEVVIREHYLHRRGPCSAAFGLFRGDELMGVVTYGTPSSAPLRSGVAGKENALNVIELTRLWVHDSVPKNGESFLIGNTIKKSGKEIVVSFADTSQNHVGVVYQATNWLYTGLSAKRTDWHVSGESKHGQTWADSRTSQQMRDDFGDSFTLVPRPRKHRYIFINAKGARKKEILSALMYPVLPYPKAEAA